MSAIHKENSSTQSASRRIAVIGSGPVGVGLAKQLVKTGHSVSLSNSRGPHTLTRQEQETGARPMVTEDAVAEADVVILGTPLASVTTLRRVLEKSLRPSTIFIDCCNYYPSRDGQIEALDNGLSDSVWVAQNFSAPVVKAFNNIIAANLVTSARAKGSSERSALPVSGDDSNAVEAVMALVEDVGFDAYSAGLLADSWRYQPGQPAYCTEPTLEQLPGLLARADREQGPLNREKARAMFDKLPENYSPQTLLRVARLSVGLDRWHIRTWLSAVAFVFTLLKGTLKKQGS